MKVLNISAKEPHDFCEAVFKGTRGRAEKLAQDVGCEFQEAEFRSEIFEHFWGSENSHTVREAVEETFWMLGNGFF